MTGPLALDLLQRVVDAIGMREDVVAILRIVYFGAVALCLTAGGLVAASLFMPDRAPRSGVFLGISRGITGFFVVLGILPHGKQRHVAGIAAHEPAPRGGGTARGESLRIGFPTGAGRRPPSPASSHEPALSGSVIANRRLQTGHCERVLSAGTLTGSRQGRPS